jgi:imidazolonepropionase-like amidohydrolase
VTIAYTAARVFDAVSEGILEDGAVLVEGDRIAWVGPAASAPRSDEVVDLGDSTLLPGLIDAHVHLAWSGQAEPNELVERESRYMTVLRCVANAQRQLQAGVTTVRDLGSPDSIAVEVARAVELGLVPGPRVLAAGRIVAMTGGHAWYLGREADGPDAVRRAVREEFKRGASWLKLMASGGVFSGENERPGAPEYTIEELRAGVEEAHRSGRKAAAHAISLEAIRNALDAGVDSIEHGSFLDRETAERMRQRGTYLVPTLSFTKAYGREGPAMGLPKRVLDLAAEVSAASEESLRLALAAGVPIAAGSDSGVPGQPHGALIEELRQIAGAGATPEQALKAATSAAATLLGLDDRIGALRPGAAADLLAVEGDSTTDIQALSKTCLVVKGGVQVCGSSPGVSVISSKPDSSPNLP